MSESRQSLHTVPAGGEMSSVTTALDGLVRVLEAESEASSATEQLEQLSLRIAAVAQRATGSSEGVEGVVPQQPAAPAGTSLGMKGISSTRLGVKENSNDDDDGDDYSDVVATTRPRAHDHGLRREGTMRSMRKHNEALTKRFKGHPFDFEVRVARAAGGRREPCRRRHIAHSARARRGGLVRRCMLGRAHILPHNHSPSLTSTNCARLVWPPSDPPRATTRCATSTG